ncbi:basic proline-rich protein-like [Oppia nitens]|uniref:basic proline-rich protein-like n=1 Tax=Oppia nitens TaxID=1686743 RepID=UPI0023D98A14|nr:basic proline-rich protein-like [Oppia nitens]
MDPRKPMYRLPDFTRRPVSERQPTPFAPMRPIVIRPILPKGAAYYYRPLGGVRPQSSRLPTPTLRRTQSLPTGLSRMGSDEPLSSRLPSPPGSPTGPGSLRPLPLLEPILDFDSESTPEDDNDNRSLIGAPDSPKYSSSSSSWPSPPGSPPPSPRRTPPGSPPPSPRRTPPGSPPPSPSRTPPGSPPPWPSRTPPGSPPPSPSRTPPGSPPPWPSRTPPGSPPPWPSRTPPGSPPPSPSRTPPGSPPPWPSRTPPGSPPPWPSRTPPGSPPPSPSRTPPGSPPTSPRRSTFRSPPRLSPRQLRHQRPPLEPILNFDSETSSEDESQPDIRFHTPPSSPLLPYQRGNRSSSVRDIDDWSSDTTFPPTPPRTPTTTRNRSPFRFRDPNTSIQRIQPIPDTSSFDRINQFESSNRGSYPLPEALPRDRGHYAGRERESIESRRSPFSESSAAASDQSGSGGFRNTFRRMSSAIRSPFRRRRGTYDLTSDTQQQQQQRLSFLNEEEEEEQ